jgi:hypothetical protein
MVVISLVTIVCVAIIIANYAPSFHQTPAATLPPTQTTNPLVPQKFQVFLTPLSQTIEHYSSAELGIMINGGQDYPCTVTVFGGSGNPLSYFTYKSTLVVHPNGEQAGKTITYTVTVKDSKDISYTSNQVQAIYK